MKPTASDRPSPFPLWFSPKRPSRASSRAAAGLSGEGHLGLALAKNPVIHLKDKLVLIGSGFRRKGGMLPFILPIFMSFLIATTAQSADLAFERIKRSLPQREAGWSTLEAGEFCHQRDGSRQAEFVWAKDAEEVRATVIRYKSLKAAKGQFRRSPKGEPAMERFRVAGIGDEAYLFPPIILHQEGPFNLRFRKGQYEIMMSTHSKETIVRCAKYVADAIAE